MSTVSVPTLNDLSNTFVLTSASGSGRVLSEIPKTLSVDPSRQRRAHSKSKTGCENCKRRRIKCSEETPCANCIRRGDRCQRQIREVSVPRMPTQAPSYGLRSTNATVNLLHMKLFHHFHTSTRPTLLCGLQAWDYVIQVSFEFDYLMNAILSIAARHLSVINPDDPTYGALAASHLCRASSGLRDALSKGGTSINLDVFLATSLLFYYDTWASADYFLPEQEDETAPDEWTDLVFGFSSSLKKTLLTGFEHHCKHPSVFRQCLTKNPEKQITEASQPNPGRLAEFEDFFSYHRPLSVEMLNKPPTHARGKDQTKSSFNPDYVVPTKAALDPAEDAYAVVARRLCLILSFLSQGDSPDSASSPDLSSMLPLLAEFTLSFPMLGWSTFPTLIDRGDSHALFLLYHFYRAVTILLSHKDWWWARKRAVMAEGVLRKHLINKITNQPKT